MQQTESSDEAEQLRIKLEDKFAPNQVLGSGADLLVARLIEGIPGATVAGKVESWELLAQLAAGAVPPTAARVEVVSSTQVAFRVVVPKIVELLGSGSNDTSDYLAVDVLDAISSFLERPLPVGVVSALNRFAARGAREAERIRVILADG